MTDQGKTYCKLGVLIVGAMLALTVSFFGCQPNSGQSTLGNGQIDAVEAATIRVAVGLAMAAKPETIAPAYAVSTALLAILADESGAVASVAMIRDAVAGETAKLDLDPVTAASFTDLVGLIEARIAEQLAAADIPSSGRMVVIREVIRIVQEAAAARLPLVGTKLAA
ncbi:hypothetical protein [Desulfobulbus elongatus]|uniref:hypothetical protein n=1 Tax=Desulfobulbus elongatus TaxID=53332 RepID=UPI000AD436C3|nr:hypothetical protein [Desulfobulbus elongatus]